MSFGNTSFRKPKSRKQGAKSDKWVDLQPRERKAPGLKRIGKKGEFWQFVSKIIDRFFAKIGLVDTCEIVETVCDNYHRAWAHTRRRQDIRVGDWYYVLRVLRGCQECHFWADSQGRRIAETILEPIIEKRFKKMGLTEERVKQLLLECAAEIQALDAQSENPKYQTFVVEL